MSDKTNATERIRQLLDDRGVEYSREGCETFFKNVHIWAINNKELCISISGLSPEQAAEATLGRGTCRIDYHFGEWYCTGCGEMVGTCDPTSELYIDGNAIELWSYCPNCGRKVVE